MVEKDTKFTSGKYADAFAQSSARPATSAGDSRYLAKPTAQANALIAAFSQTAENLQKQEIAFVTREKPQGLSLTQYLRSPEHIDAERKFEAAGQALTKANPDMGAKLVQKAMDQIQVAVEAAQISQFKAKPSVGTAMRR